MIEQQIKDAADAANKVKNELKELEKQHNEFRLRMHQIPDAKLSLKNELKQIGDKATSVDDVERLSKKLHQERDLLDQEMELLRQKTKFILKQIDEKRCEVNEAVISLNITRERLIKTLEGKIISNPAFMKDLIELRSAQYAFAATNGSSLRDDYAWIWEVADATSDSDAVDEKMLKTFCI